MSEHRMREKRRRALLWTAIAVLTVLMLALSVWLMGPAPPTQIVMATGSGGGSFQPFGDQYRAWLENMGLRVQLVPTHGSVDNLKRLVDGEVDVAFVHGGARGCVEDPEGVLRGLVTIQFQPVWVFYRASQPARTPSDFAGRTVAVGPAGSGSEAVAKQVLKAHGVTEQNARFDNVAFEDADRAFADGKIDAAMLLSASDNAMILALLNRSELALMDFSSQGMAHTRYFPYLKPVILYEGLFSLKDNVPSKEKTVLATAAMLVCRKDLHPRVVEQLLKAAQSIHSQGDLLNDPDRFPSLDGVSLPVHDAAETYMKSGESWLSRVLPYRAARWMWRLRILVLPLVLVWLPFLKIVPMIYNYRVNGLVKRHYAALRELETSIAHADSPDALQRGLRQLEDLRGDMEGLSRKVPSQLQGDIYQWRLHVSLVRTEALDRVRRLNEGVDLSAPHLGPHAQRTST